MHAIARNRSPQLHSPPMTPAERIASHTWRRLQRAHLVGARLGEETLTDLLVLDMLPYQRMNTFSIRHPTKQQESRIGADLLLCIRYSNGSAHFLAVQAKKLYPSGRYEALAHKDTSGIRQIDKLDMFARRWGAVPVYLLYNHLDQILCRIRPWSCCRSYDTEQLGCTLVPSWLIRQAIQFRGWRTFCAIHECESARPWRCVFDCENPSEQVEALALSQPEPRVRENEVFFHQKMPEWIQTGTQAFDSLFEIDEPLAIEDANELFTRLVEPSDVDFDDSQLTYPRRVLAVDVGDSRKESRKKSNKELPQ